MSCKTLLEICGRTVYIYIYVIDFNNNKKIIITTKCYLVNVIKHIGFLV